METFRERGERDAEIEACLHTGNPINQHVNTSPFPPLSASSFKTISVKAPGQLTRGETNSGDSH